MKQHKQLYGRHMLAGTANVKEQMAMKGKEWTNLLLKQRNRPIGKKHKSGKRNKIT
jgi:hypothetical protein